MLRFTVEPKINQFAARGKAMRSSQEENGRRVEAAQRSQLRPALRLTLTERKQNVSKAGREFNFEFVAVKTPMNAFTNRLGRVYQGRNIRSLCITSS
jgi:hypothetical protein